MAKLYASLTSKIYGLNSMTLVFSNNEDASHIIDFNYSEKGDSFYSKIFTTKELKELMDFLQKTLEGQ